MSKYIKVQTRTYDEFIRQLELMDTEWDENMFLAYILEARALVMREIAMRNVKKLIKDDTK